jgi:hypothetical protein
MSEMGIFRHLSDFDSMSERNLDAKGCSFYSLPRKPCNSSLELSLRAQLRWDSPSSSVRLCHACQQGLPLSLFFRIGCANDFLYQLR